MRHLWTIFVHCALIFEFGQLLVILTFGRTKGTIIYFSVNVVIFKTTVHIFEMMR